MLQFLPEAHVSKLLLDSAHDAMAYYEYCSVHGIQPFIDLNGKGGHRMRWDGIKTAKGRTKFKCPKISFAGGSPAYTSEHPCSDATYGRTVHLVLKDKSKAF